MVTEPKNQDVNVTQSADEPERTFTQEEVNRIVSNRVAKYADYEQLKEKARAFDQAQEDAKSDLQKAQEKAASLQTEIDQLKKRDSVRAMRDEVAKETGIPVSMLTFDTEDECKKQAQTILDYIKKTPGYPAVRDGGEVGTVSKGTAKQQFEEWAKEALG